MKTTSNNENIKTTRQPTVYHFHFGGRYFILSLCIGMSCVFLIALVLTFILCASIWMDTNLQFHFTRVTRVIKLFGKFCCLLWLVWHWMVVLTVHLHLILHCVFHFFHQHTVHGHFSTDCPHNFVFLLLKMPQSNDRSDLFLFWGSLLSSAWLLCVHIRLIGLMLLPVLWRPGLTVHTDVTVVFTSQMFWCFSASAEWRSSSVFSVS